jgi:serine/threonine-protein phosphatase 6 regulatory subunit 3
VEKLVSYLVDPPPPDADPKREYKYPYLACEIFSCEIDAILGALTDDDCALFSRVMSFIDVPPGTRLNSMLAGYFSKTVTCLVSRRAAECVGWFQSNPNFVNRLVEHVGTLAVAEVLLRLVGADDPGSMMPMQSMLLSAMGAGGDQD